MLTIFPSLQRQVWGPTGGILGLLVRAVAQRLSSSHPGHSVLPPEAGTIAATTGPRPTVFLRSLLQSDHSTLLMFKNYSMLFLFSFFSSTWPLLPPFITNFQPSKLYQVSRLAGLKDLDLTQPLSQDLTVGLILRSNLYISPYTLWMYWSCTDGRLHFKELVQLATGTIAGIT